jgi:hypothetical protein
MFQTQIKIKSKGNDLKLKGGSLYIAIIVSIIIGLVLSFLILLARFNQKQITVFSQSSQLLWNLKSGFEMAQSENFSIEHNAQWIKNTFNDDSIQVEKKAWGAFILIKVKTKNRHESLKQSGLYGTYMSADTALVLVDNSRPIGVCGNINFMANCYLPNAGIKPVYIEGSNYNGNANNKTFIRKAPFEIPEVNNELIKAWRKQQNELNDTNDSLVNELPTNCKQTFNAKTIVCINSNTQLSNLHLKNNIKLVCDNVSIDSTCHFDNILIVCNKIHIKQGFKGRLHVIAKDSIVCESNCTFNYPSSFILLPDEKNNKAFNYIQLSSGCLFYGGLLAINSNANSEKKVMIRLHKDCEVNGLVFSNQLLHLEGEINANVFAQKLLLKTPSAVYENHLMNCELNPKKYASVMAVPLLFKTNAKLICCEKTI